MKKHIVPVMNIVLILVLVAGIGLLLYRGTVRADDPDTAPTEAATQMSPATSASSSGERYRVGILQKSERASAQKCYEGFLTELNSRGVLDRVDVSYVLETDAAAFREKTAALIDDGCDLLYAIGTSAAKTAVELTTDIPIVFAGVNDPGQEGLVESNEIPGGNVTGVSSYTPCFEQIDIIPVLLPNAHKIGAVYCQTDEDAVTQAIIAEREAASDLVNLDLTRYPVTRAGDIADAMKELIADKNDVIYVPADNLLYQNIDTVVKYATKNKIPIICGDEKTLEKGGFAVCVIDHAAMGRAAGGLCCSILFDGANPAELPVIYKYDCFNYVNENVMQQLGIKLSDKALGMVELISYTSEEES